MMTTVRVLAGRVPVPTRTRASTALTQICLVLLAAALVACGDAGSSSGVGGGGDFEGALSGDAATVFPTGDDASPTGIRLKELKTGGSVESAEVTTSAPLEPGSGELYIAAISSRPPSRVVSVEGLGLTWTQVGEQCSSRGVTSVSVWQAMGDPGSSDTVSASFDAELMGAVISVSRFEGADAQEPIGELVSGNTLGPDGACVGGTDSSSYAFDLDTTAEGSVVYAVAAMRNKKHDPSPAFSERVEIAHGDGGSAASLAVLDSHPATPAKVSVAGGFSGDVDWAVMAFELKPAGSSIPRPDLRVEPASSDFGTVLAETKKSQTITVFNDGIGDLHVSSTAIGGADRELFTVEDGGAPFSVAPGSSHDITVTMSPTVIGDPEAVLHLESDDPDQISFGVALMGKSVDTVESDIVAEPAGIDFGFVTVGESSLVTLTVVNDGLAALQVESAVVGGGDESPFSIESGDAPFAVPPGRTREIALRFEPAAEGTASATLQIASDDLDEPRLDVVLSGTGAMIKDGIWISAEELASKPMFGDTWRDVKRTADSELIFQPVSKLASDHDTQTLAVALVYARTGDEFYREKTLDEIKTAMGTEVGAAQAVGPCRNIVPYVISADLIDLENFDPAFDATFREWIDELRFIVWPDGSMIAEDEDRANNHGRMCGAARVAIDVYLDDQDDLDRAATVFRGLLGDQEAYDGFLWKHDLSWQADQSNPVGVNPVGAVIDGLSVDGALPEEMRRGGPFQIPPVQTGYPWEALQGMMVEAVILQRAGYFDVFEWSDRAILRIVEFVERLDQQFPGAGWWATGDDRWLPWVINDVYGTNFPYEEASHGKLMAWTDWTHAP